MIRTLAWIFLLLCCPLWGLTQNHANYWYFGNHAGVNFNSGTPVATSNGQQNTFEGGTSYCDHNGNLMFYSDGLTVWNRNHQVMTNGTGLLGGLSSTTSALVVRQPGNCKRFYLFTVEDHQSFQNSLRYSVIDMSLSGGLGAVVAGSKNILISNDCAEKIVAIRHQNGVDSWIITHYLGNASFAAYRLSSTGLNMVPVISTVGAVHPSNCMIGFLKSNHAGNLLICSQMFCSSVQLFDFNRNTGQVTNARAVLNNLNGVYGAEFSPNDAILYLTKCFGGNALYQVNPTNLAMTNLVASMPGNYDYGGLQLGPNGKIYMARNATSFLGVINSPDTWGAGCGFAVNGFSLAPGTSSGFGIVSFPETQMHVFSPGGYQIDGNDTCYAATVPFQGLGIVEYDSIVWNFGDPVTGALNHGSGLSPSHVFSSTGQFQVTMMVFGCEPDTVVLTVNVLPCVLSTSVELFARRNPYDCQLTWTAVQPGTYHLERSLDGRRFREIHAFSVASADSSLGFLDTGIERETGYFYRLRIIGDDGMGSFSNTVEVRGLQSVVQGCKVYPTVIEQGTDVHVKCVQYSPGCKVEWVDVWGRIHPLEWRTNGTEVIVGYPATARSNGLYFLRLSDEFGQRAYRIVVR